MFGGGYCESENKIGRFNENEPKHKGGLVKFTLSIAWICFFDSMLNVDYSHFKV